MIELRKGNLLEAEAEALVNTVNCVGVMGKGIALQFKRAFPTESKEYIQVSKLGGLKPGQILVSAVNPKIDQDLPRYIIHFATKNDWRKPSEIEWIRDGLVQLVEEVKRRNIRSIAVPPLGCGHGGLAWNIVEPMIVNAFAAIPDVRVLLFSPEGAPSAEEMKHNEPVPNMTFASALCIQLLKNYCVIEPRFTQIVLQKLVYFLQEAGEPALKYKFVKGPYGPYAPDMRHIFGRGERHWFSGYGDGTGGINKPMVLNHDATKNANNILLEQKDAALWERLARVSELVAGYEFDSGVELLATVHFVAKQNPMAEQDIAIAIQDVHKWSHRKREAFDEGIIYEGWGHLHTLGWLNMSPQHEDRGGLSREDYIAITTNWEQTNERRIDLIYKEVEEEITEVEMAELEHLQQLADARVKLIDTLPAEEDIGTQLKFA